MTAETAPVLHPRAERWMSVLGIPIHMACQAAAATIPRNIVGMSSLVLAEMAARAALAQQGVGRAVGQLRQVPLAPGCRVFPEHVAGDIDHPPARGHEPVTHRCNTLGMAAATGPRRVGEIAWKDQQPLVGGMLIHRLPDPTVAGGTVRLAEPMILRESLGLLRVAGETTVRGLRHRARQTQAPSRHAPPEEDRPGRTGDQARGGPTGVAHRPGTRSTQPARPRRPGCGDCLAPDRPLAKAVLPHDEPISGVPM